jgi:hypothetical protein
MRVDFFQRCVPDNLPEIRKRQYENIGTCAHLDAMARSQNDTKTKPALSLFPSNEIQRAI